MTASNSTNQEESPDDSARATFTEFTSINEAATKGLMGSLFGKSAVIIGDYFGERTEVWINGRRIKNTEQHRDAVKRNAEAKFKQPSVKTLSLLDAWLREAQDYGTEQPEQASLWRAVLEKIVIGSNQEELIAIAKSLNTDEIKLLMKISRLRRGGLISRLSENDVHLQKLITSGLIRQDVLVGGATSIVLGIFILMFAFILKMYVITANEFFSFLVENLKQDFLSAAFAFVVLVVPFGVFIYKFSLSFYYATRLGGSLSRQIGKYLSEILSDSSGDKRV